MIYLEKLEIHSDIKLVYIKLSNDVSDDYSEYQLCIEGMTRKNEGLIKLRLIDLLHTNVSMDYICKNLESNFYPGKAFVHCIHHHISRKDEIKMFN